MSLPGSWELPSTWWRSFWDLIGTYRQVGVAGRKPRAPKILDNTALGRVQHFCTTFLKKKAVFVKTRFSATAFFTEADPRSSLASRPWAQDGCRGVGFWPIVFTNVLTLVLLPTPGVQMPTQVARGALRKTFESAEMLVDSLSIWGGKQPL